MTYFYQCPTCGPVEQAASVEERNNQKCAVCGSALARDLSAQFKHNANHVRVPAHFNEFTKFDLMDRDVLGRSRYDPVRQDYVRRTVSAKGGRWV